MEPEKERRVPGLRKPCQRLLVQCFSSLERVYAFALGHIGDVLLALEGAGKQEKSRIISSSILQDSMYGSFERSEFAFILPGPTRSWFQGYKILKQIKTSLVTIIPGDVDVASSKSRRDVAALFENLCQGSGLLWKPTVGAGGLVNGRQY
jgi:hypothetical protein